MKLRRNKMIGIRLSEQEMNQLTLLKNHMGYRTFTDMFLNSVTEHTKNHTGFNINEIFEDRRSLKSQENVNDEETKG